MKKFLGMLILGVSALTSNLAFSHGEPFANHGGLVQAVGDSWIELVVKGDNVDVYLQDDGDDVATAAVTGTASVVKGATKTPFVLKPAGGNKLSTKAKGAVKGTKLALALVIDGSKVYATFDI